MQNSREPKARAAALAFVEQNARTAWELARHRARPPTVQQAGFLQHSRPCQTFGLAVAPIFWLFKATQFNLFACQVVWDPRERASAAAAARQVDLLAADRTSQHRVDVKYIEVLEAGCFRKCHSHFPYMLRMRTASFQRQLTSMRCPCAGRRRRHPHGVPPSDPHRIDAEPWRIDRGAPSRSGVISNLIYMV